MFLQVQNAPLGASKFLSEISRHVTVSVPHPQAPSTSPGSAPKRCVEDGWPQAWCSAPVGMAATAARGLRGPRSHDRAARVLFPGLERDRQVLRRARGNQSSQWRRTGPPGDKPPAHWHPSVDPHDPARPPRATTFSPVCFLFRCPKPASRPPPRCTQEHARAAASLPASSRKRGVGPGARPCSSLYPPAGTLEAAGTSDCLFSLQQC